MSDLAGTNIGNLILIGTPAAIAFGTLATTVQTWMSHSLCYHLSYHVPDYSACAPHHLESIPLSSLNMQSVMCLDSRQEGQEK